MNIFSPRLASLSLVFLIIAITAVTVSGLFTNPQRADAWMTDTGQNWKSASEHGFDPLDWEDTGATLPSGLSSSQIAIIGDYVYLFGGYDGSPTDVIYRAPLSDPTSWTDTGAALPDDLAGSQLAIIGDHVYLFGGTHQYWAAYNDIYRAPLSNPTAWFPVGELSDGLLHSHLAIVGDYVYLFGGVINVAGTTDAIHRAPLSSPTSWTVAASSGTSGGYGFFESEPAVIGDYVYKFGGVTTVLGSSESDWISAAIQRAPLSDPTSWTDTGATLPGSGLSDSQLAIIGDYVYLFGGASDDGQFIYWSDAIYRASLSDPTSWEDTGATLPGGTASAQLAIIGEYVYIFGGGANSNAIYRAPLNPSGEEEPQCSVSADDNPLTVGTTTLRWSSTGADTSFYINNVGYVTPNATGSATVGPLETTNYDGTAEGPGGTVNCEYTLTVGEGQCIPEFSCSGGGVLNSCTEEVEPCAEGEVCSDGQCIPDGQCAPGYFCADDDLYYRTTACQDQFVQACVFGCTGSFPSASCTSPPEAQFVPFTAFLPNGASFQATGELQARPALVRQGETAQLYWNTANVGACSVIGTNGFSSTSTFSGAPGQNSGAIVEQTTFTLDCIGLEGEQLSDSAVVNVLPIFQEQ